MKHIELNTSNLIIEFIMPKSIDALLICKCYLLRNIKQLNNIKLKKMEYGCFV